MSREDNIRARQNHRINTDAYDWESYSQTCEDVSYLLSENDRLRAEMEADKRDDAMIGVYPVTTGSTFHGTQIIGVDYVNRTVTLAWRGQCAENGGTA